MIIKCIKPCVDLNSGDHNHLVFEASEYTFSSHTLEDFDRMDFFSILSEEVEDYGHSSDKIIYIVSEDARMRLDDGQLKVFTFKILETDNKVIVTDLPVYVCNDNGKTIDSYNT